MKKILVPDVLKPLLVKQNSFLSRADVKMFSATTNDDILAVHRAEKVNLIISQLNMPGMKTEELFAVISNDRELRRVSLIMLCDGAQGDKERAEQCHAHAVMTLPVDAALLLEKARSLLGILWRASYRVLLSINIAGTAKDKAFFCKSENISTTGLLVETDRDLKEGDRVTCSFFLPESKQIVVAGEIIRSIHNAQKAGVKRHGVRFEKLTPDAKAAIENFVAAKEHSSLSEPATP